VSTGQEPGAADADLPPCRADGSRALRPVAAVSRTRAEEGVQAATSPLAGTGRVADDLYLMAHDENTGRPLIGPRLLGTGLAAALLAELILADGLVLHNGRVGGVTLNSGMVLACRAEIRDDLARHVHQVVAAEPQLHPVQVWLEFLACDAARSVAFRLGLIAVAVTALAGFSPMNGLFFGLGTTGGFGILLLLAATAIAVIAFFARDPRGETTWRRLAAPALVPALLIVIVLLRFRRPDVYQVIGLGAAAAVSRVMP
jgi:hypothetical protein